MPVQDTQKLRFEGEGVIRRLRYDDTVQYVRQTDDTLVVKCPGRKTWAGLGREQSYAPAEYVVYNVVGRTDGSPVIEVVQLISFPVTAKKS